MTHHAQLGRRLGGRLALAALLTVSALLPLAHPAEAAGSNNLFPIGGVASITGSTFAETTTGILAFTRDSGEIGTCGLFPAEEPPGSGSPNTHSAWYQYAASADGWFTVDTVGSNYDTVLEIFTATVGTPTSFSQLVSVACDDDAGVIQQSQIGLAVTNGVTYYIVIRDFDNSASGSLSLTLNAAFSTQQILHVNRDTGNDANPGTASLPVKTIQHGVNVVSAGGVVSVTSGLYSEGVTIDKALTLTGTAPVTVTSFTLNSGALLGSGSGGPAAPAVTVNPGARIQDGVTLIATNGTVAVAAGSFTETVTLSKRLTLQGASAATTFLEPAIPASDAFLITSGPVTVTGFTVQNANAAVRATGGSGHTLSGNNFLSSAGVTATVSITAAQNYWDDFSGPTHASNVGGVGVAVSSNATFSPWCTAPAPACTPLSAVPTVLTFTVQPTDTLKDEIITPLPVLRAQDANGVAALNFNAPVTLTTNLYGSIVISGTNPETASAGVVTHTLAITQAGMGYTLSASAPSVWSLPPAVSNSFRVFSHPPTANDDTFTINEDAPNNPLDVLDNDTDPDLDALQILTVTAPAHGTVITSAALITYTPAAHYFGADVFTYTMSDVYLSGISTATVMVTVTSVNDAPSFVKGANQTVNEDAPAQTVSGWATSISPGPANEGGQTVTFTVTNDHTALFSAQPAVSPVGTLTFTPAPDAFGAATVTITATDSGGTGNGGVDTSASQTFTITVNSMNDAPTFTGGGDVTVTEDSGAYSGAWAGSISSGPANESAQTVTFTTSNNNAALFSIQPSIGLTGSLTFSTAADAFGAATVTVTATDNGGTANGGVNISAPQTFTITLTAVNDPPTLNPISDPAAINEDAPTQTVALSGIGSGAANEEQVLTVSAVSGDTALIPHPTVIYTSANAGGSLQYAPVPDAFGSTTITVTVQDNGGGADTLTRTFTVTVNPVNDAPSFTGGGDVGVLEDSGAYSSAWAGGISFGPLNETPQTVTFSVSNNNSALFFAPPAIASDGTLTFTPAATANGTATVTVRAVDNGGTANGGQNTSAAQTFVITVTAVNDAPSFTNGTDRTVLEDAGPQTINNWATSISRGPSDEAGQTLTFTLTNDNNALFSAQPALSSAGALTFTPAPNLNGSTNVTVTLQDSGGTANGGADTSAPQSFIITVTAVNDAPSFTAGPSLTVTEDAGAQTFAGWATGMARGPSDEAGQTLTFALTPSVPSLFSAGPVLDTAAGDLSFTPAPDANGVTTVTIVLSDNGGTANGGVNVSALQVFTLTITAVNDTPSFAVGPNITVAEDSGAYTQAGWAASISAGAANEAGQALTFTLTPTVPSLFSVPPAVSITGTLTFSPAANANGVTAVSIRLRDDGGGADTSAAQVFTITLTPVNDPPTANSDTFTVLEDSANNALTVLANDTFAPDTGEALTIVGVTTAGHGVVNNLGGATLAYTPTANFFGAEVFTYTLSDGSLTATARVTVNVTNLSDPLMAVDDAYTVTEDSLNNALDVLSNDSAANPDSGEVLTITTFTAAGHGTLVKVGNTSFRYTPFANYFGADVFTYTVTDGATSDDAVVTLTVTAVNDVFTAVDDSYSVTEGSTANALDVLTNDNAANPDTGEPITLTLVTSAAHGTVALSGTAVLSYTPAVGFSGTDVFTYTATDGVTTDTARVSVTVLYVNDPLLALDDVYTLTEDSAANVLDVLTNDNAANVDVGETLTITEVSAPGNGALTALGQTLLYTPTAHYFGADSFAYTVTDGVYTDTALITLTVLSVNDAPTLTLGADVTVLEDSGPYTSAAWASGIAPGPPNESAQTLTATLTPHAPALFTTPPALELATGTLTFAPAPEANGVTTVTLVLRDDGGTANSGVDTLTHTFTITITSVNDMPTANDDAFRVMKDSANNALDVLANDTFAPDTGETLAIASVTTAGHGAVVISGAGLAYTPTAGYAGTDIFTYTVSDGVLTDTATVTMTVAAPTFVYLPLVVRPRSAAPGCILLYNTDGPKPIPDNDAGGAFSVITVPNSFSLTNLTVGIENLQHSYTSDLEITLRAPDGRTVLLVYRLGADGDNFVGTLLNDNYATPIEQGAPPFSGTFRPDNPLAGLYGGNVNGNWELTVADRVAGDTGVLYQWSLELCGP